MGYNHKSYSQSARRFLENAPPELFNGENFVLLRTDSYQVFHESHFRLKNKNETGLMMRIPKQTPEQVETLKKAFFGGSFSSLVSVIRELMKRRQN
jgi:hypothetical protein